MGKSERSQSVLEDDSTYRAPDLRLSGQIYDRQTIAAFLSYLALSILIFGRGVLANPATAYLGRGPDPQQYIWFLAWWVHAISHRLNPFLVKLVWAPSGVNLAWAVDFPLAASLLYPITRLWGPIVSSNLLHLIAPPLAGWSAFVLCRYVVQRFWPAWLGGCIFAFSPYMLTGMIGFLMLVFPLPLAVWATLRRLAVELSARRFVTILVTLLVAQFLMSPEIFATGTLFGAIAIALAARSASDEERTPLLSVGVWIILAYAISAVLLLPYLYYMFAFGMPRGAILVPWRFSTDLLNFLVPTNTNQLGNFPVFGAIAHGFLAQLTECSGYIGLPLIAIIVLFARERWSDRSCRFIVYMFGCACILAMGPLLEVAGYRLLPLPGAALATVPLFNKVTPARLMLYAYLALTLIVAMWLAPDRKDAVNRQKPLRWALGLAIIPFMLPNLSTSFWTTAAEIPAFFSDGLYRQYLTPGETVMVLPYGIQGEGMLWQAVTGMYFRTEGGYVGLAPPVPEEHSRWPITGGLYQVSGVPEASDQLKAYLANHDVSAIILGPRSQYLTWHMGNQLTIATWLRWPTLDRERIPTQKLLTSLDAQPLQVGGITLYRIAPQTLAPYRQLTALDMQRRADRARFERAVARCRALLGTRRQPRIA